MIKVAWGINDLETLEQFPPTERKMQKAQSMTADLVLVNTIFGNCAAVQTGQYAVEK